MGSRKNVSARKQILSSHTMVSLQGLAETLGEYMDTIGMSDFKTGKSVVFHDRRLGFIYYFTVLMILLYTAVDTWLYKRYLANVEPITSVNMWTSELHPSQMKWASTGRCTESCPTTAGFEQAVTSMYDWYKGSGGEF